MDKGKAPSQTLLDFSPEPATRTSRVEDLLNSSPTRAKQPVTLPPRSLDELRGLSLPVNPDLMQRLQSFLPAMEQSTSELQQRAEADPTGLDIEHLNPETQEYIEMNLGLGVYESRANRPPQSTDSDSSGLSDTESSTSSSSSDSDSDLDSDSDSGRPDVLSILMSAVPPVPRVHPPARPNITMLHSPKSPASRKSP
ncbi:hypothetical protein BDV93DRAFT_29172 [Ceratobasidium sp. AG-I]|nr:hypothetical protein BDV93DRAFT_29172 [Ceratobasidium sp. AG-I]